MLTATEATALLTAVLNQFDLRLTSPTQVAPGAPVTASVLPAVTQLNAVEALTGLVNAGDLSRHLAAAPAFTDLPTTTTPDDIVRAVGGAPAAASTAQGEVSQLLAGLELSVPRIDIKVQWSLRTPDGEATEGDDFVAPSGLALPSVELLVVPPIVELTEEVVGATVANLKQTPPTLPLEQWCLYARVTATLGTVRLARDLGPVPLLVAPLPIPTVVALCNRRDFNVTGKGKAFLLTRPQVAVSSLEELNEVLQAAYAVLNRLRTVAKLAGWVLGVGRLLSLLQATYIGFYARERIDHFDDYPLYTRQFWSDESMNDAAESVLIVGPPGGVVELYNEADNKPGEGILVVRIPVTGFVALRSLWPPAGGPDARPHLVMMPQVGDDWRSILIDDGFENDDDDDGFANSLTGVVFRTNTFTSTPLRVSQGCAPPTTTEPFPLAQADVQLRAVPGERSHRLEVKNAGPDPAPGVAVDIEGSQAVVTGVKATQGTATKVGDGARVAVGDMAPGATVDITFDLKARGGDFGYRAVARSVADDPDLSNNEVTGSTVG